MMKTQMYTTLIYYYENKVICFLKSWVTNMVFLLNHELKYNHESELLI